MRLMPSKDPYKNLILCWIAFLLLFPLYLLEDVALESKNQSKIKIEQSEFIEYAQSETNCFYKDTESMPLNNFRSGRAKRYMTSKKAIYARIHSRLYTLYLSEYRDNGSSISGEYSFTNEEEKILLSLFQ